MYRSYSQTVRNLETDLNTIIVDCYDKLVERDGIQYTNGVISSVKINEILCKMYGKLVKINGITKGVDKKGDVAYKLRGYIISDRRYHHFSLGTVTTRVRAMVADSLIKESIVPRMRIVKV